MNSAAVSIVFDTMWLLARSRVPHALERVNAPPELLDEVRRAPFSQLFEDEHTEPMELPVLASRAGAVFGEEPEPFLRELPAALEAPVEDDALWLEPPYVRLTGTARLRALRRNPELRASYVRVVQRAVELVRPVFAQDLERLRTEADRLQQALDEGASLDQLLPAEHGAFLDRYRIAVAQAFKHGNVVLTPVRLCSDGGHVIGLRDYQVSLGVPLSKVRSTRKRTQSVAARSASSLAALGDPTRLAILVTLIKWPRTAEELADTLSLSRSSISEHLAALRDLGLVTGAHGRRPEVHHADADALRAYLGSIANELIEAARAQLFHEQP